MKSLVLQKTKKLLKLIFNMIAGLCFFSTALTEDVADAMPRCFEEKNNATIKCCANFLLKDGDCIPCPVGTYGNDCGPCPDGLYGTLCSLECKSCTDEECNKEIGCEKPVTEKTEEPSTIDITTSGSTMDVTFTVFVSSTTYKTQSSGTSSTIDIFTTTLKPTNNMTISINNIVIIATGSVLAVLLLVLILQIRMKRNSAKEKRRSIRESKIIVNDVETYEDIDEFAINTLPYDAVQTKESMEMLEKDRSKYDVLKGKKETDSQKYLYKQIKSEQREYQEIDECQELKRLSDPTAKAETEAAYYSKPNDTAVIIDDGSYLQPKTKETKNTYIEVIDEINREGQKIRNSSHSPELYWTSKHPDVKNMKDVTTQESNIKSNTKQTDLYLDVIEDTGKDPSQQRLFIHKHGIVRRTSSQYDDVIDIISQSGSSDTDDSWKNCQISSSKSSSNPKTDENYLDVVNK